MSRFSSERISETATTRSRRRNHSWASASIAIATIYAVAIHQIGSHIPTEVPTVSATPSNTPDTDPRLDATIKPELRVTITGNIPGVMTPAPIATREATKAPSYTPYHNPECACGVTQRGIEYKGANPTDSGYLRAYEEALASSQPAGIEEIYEDPGIPVSIDIKTLVFRQYGASEWRSASAPGMKVQVTTTGLSRTP